MYSYEYHHAASPPFQHAYYAPPVHNAPFVQDQPFSQQLDIELRNYPVVHQIRGPDRNQRQRSGSKTRHATPKRRFDFPTLFLTTAICVLLTVACGIMLLAAHYGKKPYSFAGSLVSSREIALTVAFSSIPTFAANVLNEVLLSRCWLKVECCALHLKDPAPSDAEMAKHLAAGNFGWYNFLKRTVTLKLFPRYFRTLGSWILLRWGTALAIASTQLCVSWYEVQAPTSDDESPLYTAVTHPLRILLPVCIYIFATAGTLCIFWAQAPWKLFSARYDDKDCSRVYQPQLSRVRGGSLLTSDVAAEYIQGHESANIMLGKKIRTGRQFGAKLKGVWFGLLVSQLPAAMILLYIWRNPTDQTGSIGVALYRFGFYYTFSAQNILYGIMFDFIIWNLSLEGLCRSTSVSDLRLKDRSDLRYLRESAGLYLLVKAFKQGRPLRAALLGWLFLLQACAVRFLTELLLLAIVVISRGSKEHRDDIWNRDFWIAYNVVTVAVVWPPVIVWLSTPFQTQICEKDGWRWAHVVRTAHTGNYDRKHGFYGVVREVGDDGVPILRTAWGPDVQTFEWANGETVY